MDSFLIVEGEDINFIWDTIQEQQLVFHPTIAPDGKFNFEKFYLDFDKLHKSEKMNEIINKSMLMGSLGEGYSFLNKILPNSYRINDVPAELYDGMIIVINATPTDIKH